MKNCKIWNRAGRQTTHTCITHTFPKSSVLFPLGPAFPTTGWCLLHLATLLPINIPTWPYSNMEMYQNRDIIAPLLLS